MRLLFLTNLYPPHGKGGYEEWCQEVALHLRKQGHEIIVLTSDNGRSVNELADPNWVRRELRLEMDFASLRNGVQFFTARHQRSRENFEALRTYVRRFQPDAIVVWGMWNIVRSLPILAEKLLPGRVIYYMGDYWPTLPSQFAFYWKAPAQHWYTQLPKSILGFFANAILDNEEIPKPAFERVIFPTIFLRNELVKRGVQPRESIVIYGAADTTPFDVAGHRNVNGQNHYSAPGHHGVHRANRPLIANGIKQRNELTLATTGGSSQRSALGALGPTATVLQAPDDPATDHRSIPPADKITLLWAGRLRADKGLHTAIKALAQLIHREGFTNLELLIAGTGEPDYQTFLDYLVRKEQLQPYITFLGYQQKEA
ncbi:MAG: glycosyltransferase family 4 protein, partial [Caldilineaceae bacterium]|nr:glycosyltransferase family 4 protein [Caldilineaceae bacterium]